MPKEVVVTGLGNKIEYATTNGRGLITGKREDITEQAIAAVFEHLKRELARKDPEGLAKGFGKSYEGVEGRMLYLRPGVVLEWEGDAE